MKPRTLNTLLVLYHSDLFCESVDLIVNHYTLFHSSTNRVHYFSFLEHLCYRSYKNNYFGTIVLLVPLNDLVMFQIEFHLSSDKIEETCRKNEISGFLYNGHLLGIF